MYVDRGNNWKMDDIVFENGSMPVVGLGCFFGIPAMLNQADVQSCVERSIDVGFRHFDTAYLYQTEKAVGQAIRAKMEAGVIKRNDVFITSKLSFAHHQPDDVRACVRESLRNLNTEYIDLYLILLPIGVKKPEDINDCLTRKLPNDEDHDYITVWKILEEFVREGVIRSIGVSNFNASLLQDLLDNSTVKPAVNQIEVHVYYQNTELREYCKERGVHVTAYSPLGQIHPSVQPPGWESPLKDKVLNELAKNYKKTPAQIALRFLIQQGLAVVPCSTNQDRQRENLQLFDFEITTEDMHRIETLNRRQKYLKLEHMKDHKNYPFHGVC